MSPHLNIKSIAQAALRRGLTMGFSANAASLAGGYHRPVVANTRNLKQQGGFDAPSLRGVELPLMPFQHRRGRVMLTQAQHPTSGMPDYASRLEHQLLHRRGALVQGVLSNQSPVTDSGT